MKGYGRVQAGEGRLMVSAEAWSAGNDWVVSVLGGDAPHVGAVALACTCDAPADTSGNITCFASVLTAPGHRDDVLARKLALQLCKALRRNISVSVGIHIHNATLGEIDALIVNAEKAVELLLPLLMNLR